MKVPLHYSGQENSPAVKVDACLVNPVMTELEIACLPADLPEFIAVDLSGLKKGSSLHINDITLPKGVKAVTHGKNNPVLVSVVSMAEEAAPEAAAAPAAAAPAKGKGKK
jgi:large subunit ribosomal protein L25